jgi:uncharacterized damage-inducible protein DinB
MINLANEIRKAYNGDPWHGQNVMYLLSSANPEKVFVHPVPGAHSIAELVAHLTAWTQEVAERMVGKNAEEPARGDWPAVNIQDHTTWNVLLDDFMIANEKLITICSNYTDKEWDLPVNEKREGFQPIIKKELISGLLQHHAYHSGQIALLLKF